MKNLFNKRGSHVGIVLSFVIFVTFVIFIFSILEPRIKINQNKEALLDKIKIKFVDGVSAELSNVGIFISTPNAGCELLLIDLGEIRGLNSVVKNKDGTIVGSKRNTNDKLKIDWNKIDNFYKIYSSGKELYDYSFPSGRLCIVTDFKISSTRDEKYVFEDKITNMINNKDFSVLNIPDGTGFDVMFEDAEGGVVGEQQNPGESLSVYSDRFGVQYFDKEVNIKTGFITIRVW